jgi:hypothetical protein
MTKAVPPVSATPLQRRAGRRTTDPRIVPEAASELEEALPAGTNLPVVAGPLPHREDFAAGAVEAQILGQDGQKRGLRGGKPVLDQARSAYLGAEWSGANDRRPKRGLVTKTEV